MKNLGRTKPVEPATDSAPEMKGALPVIAGVEITTDEHGRFNLNALHKASGGPGLFKGKCPFGFNGWLLCFHSGVDSHGIQTKGTTVVSLFIINKIDNNKLL